MMHLAGKVIAVTGAGTRIGFTSGAFTASVAQANYSSAKGGVVSLVRSAAAGLHKYGVTANCIAPEAKSRMSGKVPMERKMGEPLVSSLLSDPARHIAGQIDSINGGQVGVYNQPAIARSMAKDQPWTVDERVERLDNELGQEQMPIFGYLDEMRKAAAAKKAGDASG
jgi:NAD(P)-dependent dehydrogenase (short-subunit alcohol dehydrogenase family)